MRRRPKGGILMKTSKQNLCLAFFLTLLIIPRVSAAFQHRPIIQPTLLTLEGTILPPTDQGGHYVLEFQTQNTTIRFNVTDIQIRGISEWNNGWMLLNRLAPKSIRLVGRKEMLDTLTQPEAVGKGLIIYGELYNGNTFHIEGIEDQSTIPAP
jgi:hypothetical protein